MFRGVCLSVCRAQPRALQNGRTDRVHRLFIYSSSAGTLTADMTGRRPDTTTRHVDSRAPNYRLNHVIPVSAIVSRQRLRSAQQNTLVVPRYRLTTYGRRAFSVAGPTAWNSLPVALRAELSMGQFFVTQPNPTHGSTQPIDNSATTTTTATILRRLWPELHCPPNSLWIYCTECCTTNQQQIRTRSTTDRMPATNPQQAVRQIE